MALSILTSTCSTNGWVLHPASIALSTVSALSALRGTPTN